MNLAAKTIAEMLDQGRKFNRYYISLLDPARIHESYTFEGMQMNPAYFIVAHLGWTEWSFLVEQFKVPDFEAPFLAHFGKGSSKADYPRDLAFPELLKEMGRAHSAMLGYIQGLTEADLNQEIHIEVMNWTTSKRKALYHLIRHEGFHTGQLSWIAKVHGSKTP